MAERINLAGKNQCGGLAFRRLIGLQNPANPLICRITPTTRFARIRMLRHVFDQPTNLGVRSSNLFGRAST
jgi:hypothetical protein